MKRTWFLTLSFAVAGVVLAGSDLPRSGSPREGSTGRAQWVSAADTVREEIREADAVVHVRVESQAATRVLESPLGLGPAGEARVERTPFTEFQMRVLEVFQGNVEESITVLQTGGFIPGKGGYRGHRLEVEGDPLFQVGQEYVLFLVDISGDPVHAARRKLYRIVNPAGRYAIEGSRVHSDPEFGKADRRPTRLNALLTEIRQHANRERLPR
jgi:hypothetical protein